MAHQIAERLFDVLWNTAVVPTVAPLLAREIATTPPSTPAAPPPASKLVADAIALRHVVEDAAEASGEASSGSEANSPLECDAEEEEEEGEKEEAEEASADKEDEEGESHDAYGAPVAKGPPTRLLGAVAASALRDPAAAVRGRAGAGGPSVRVKFAADVAGPTWSPRQPAGMPATVHRATTPAVRRTSELSVQGIGASRGSTAAAGHAALPGAGAARGLDRAAGAETERWVVVRSGSCSSVNLVADASVAEEAASRGGAAAVAAAGGTTAVGRSGARLRSAMMIRSMASAPTPGRGRAAASLRPRPL